MEKDARARKLDVVGYYHSHPDHPARPSHYDREHAWPWYSYVIIKVESGQAKDCTSWVLTDDRSRFDPELMEVGDSMTNAAADPPELGVSHLAEDDGPKVFSEVRTPSSESNS